MKVDILQIKSNLKIKYLVLIIKTLPRPIQCLYKIKHKIQFWNKLTSLIKLIPVIK